jgi:hypothetical protein
MLMLANRSSPGLGAVSSPLSLATSRFVKNRLKFVY